MVELSLVASLANERRDGSLVGRRLWYVRRGQSLAVVVVNAVVASRYSITSLVAPAECSHLT